MANIKLFDVKDSYFAGGQGLSLVVDFPVRDSAKHKPIRETVSIVFPDSTSRDYPAVIELRHFSTTSGSKYAFVVTLPTAKMFSVPPGSQVFGSQSAAAMLLGS